MKFLNKLKYVCLILSALLIVSCLPKFNSVNQCVKCLNTFDPTTLTYRWGPATTGGSYMFRICPFCYYSWAEQCPKRPKPAEKP